MYIPQSHVSHTHTQSHVLSYTYPITYPLSYTYPNHILYLSYTYPITCPLIHIPNHISLSHHSTHTRWHVLSYTYPITCPLIHIPKHISSLVIVYIPNDMSSHTHTYSHVLSYTYPNHILYLSYTYSITHTHTQSHVPSHTHTSRYIPTSPTPQSHPSQFQSCITQSLPLPYHIIVRTYLVLYKAIASDHMWSEEKSA